MVKSIFSLLTARQTTILSGATIIMATVVISKLLGLLRYRLLADLFPPDVVAIFITATGIPEFIFNVFIFGTLSVAFIPVFTEQIENFGKEEAFKLAQSILNLCLVVLIVLSLIVYIFVDPLTLMIAPGFTPSERIQIASLMKLILIGQIILTSGSLFVGISQSFQRFVIPALAGVFYNLGGILGIIIFAKSFGIEGAAIGVIIGACLHVLIQIPVIVSFGFRLRFPPTIFHPGIKEIFKLMSVRSVGLAAEQINEVVIRSLASLVSPASVTYLAFAQQLQLAPISLFGATIAQAALPVLSLERARGRMEEFKITLLTTVHQVLFLTLPATAILIVLRIPAIRLVYGASRFDWPATVLTGQALAYLAIGLTAQSVSLLFIRAFYAMKDTRTPVIVSLITVFTNVILSFIFINVLDLQVWSLGLAFSVSGIISAILLFVSLHFKVGKFDLNLVFKPLLKMLMATIIMGVSLYIPIKLLDQVIFDTTKTINLLALTGISSFFALAVYILIVWFLDVRELNTYIALMKKIGKVQKLVDSEEIIGETKTP